MVVKSSPPSRPRFPTLVCLLSRVILCGAILDPCNQSGTIDRSTVCFRHRLGRVRAEPSTTARPFQPRQIQPGSCCFLARNGMLFVVGNTPCCLLLLFVRAGFYSAQSMMHKDRERDSPTERDKHAWTSGHLECTRAVRLLVGICLSVAKERQTQRKGCRRRRRRSWDSVL